MDDAAFNEWVRAARQVKIVDWLDGRGLWSPATMARDRGGPCPGCNGRDRFSVNAKKNVFQCRAGGAAGDVIELAQHVLGLSFLEAVAEVTKTPLPETYPRGNNSRETSEIFASSPDDAAKPLWLWRRRKPIVEDSLPWRYLRQVRGYEAPIPATLGFLPASGEYPPAMIAAFGIATEPEPGMLAIADRDVRGVHLTSLRPDGSGKAGTGSDKKTIGTGSMGAPIVLAPPNDLMGLVITEGIEDALSIHEATGLGAWAAGTEGRLPALVHAVPSYIGHVTIIADPDAGLESARKLCDALLERRICAVVSRLVKEARAA